MHQHHIYGDPNCPCARCDGANPAYVPTAIANKNLTQSELSALMWATNGNDATLRRMRADDNVDYRAMLAREVKAERAWRIFNYKQTPRDSLSQELHDGEPLRVAIERSNGEKLA